jgi:hypothetical protein
MKRIYLALTAAGLMVYLAGCCVDRHRSCGAPQNPEGCGVQSEPAQPEPTCGNDVGRACPCRQYAPMVQDPGPATGAITYPYYTTHGPRDYFDRNATDIGP